MKIYTKLAIPKIKSSIEQDENNSIEQIKFLWPNELKKGMTAIDAAKIGIGDAATMYELNKEIETIQIYIMKMLKDYQNCYESKFELEKIKPTQISVQRRSST